MTTIDNPKHFRHLRTTTDLTVIDTITLDSMACGLMREIDNLETYGKDHNGEWLGKTDKRSCEKWQKYLDAINAVLETRSDAN